MKVAEALDTFMHDYDTYGYMDNLGNGQLDMISDIRAMLNNREQAEGIFIELHEICEERSFADDQTEHIARALLGKVKDIIQSLPKRCNDLEQQISAADSKKGMTQDGASSLEPEV